jgi:tetratricopeptide (TPR) repeat protein
LGILLVEYDVSTITTFMNSGLGRNLLSLMVGALIALLLVLNLWLGIIVVAVAGFVYYRAVQKSWQRRGLFTAFRQGSTLDRELSNAPPEIEAAVAYFNRGQSLAARQDYAGAISDFDRVIWAESDHRSAYYQRALCLLAVGELESAVSDLEIAKDLAVQHNDMQLLAEIAQTRDEIPQIYNLEVSAVSSSLPELN